MEGGGDDTVERRRILLVDDNPYDVELALTAFHEGGDGYDISVAGGGHEALAALRNSAPLPDLILLDLKMPHLDGLAVLDAIRGEAVTRDIPVVMLTTSGEDRDIRACYDHGATAYVIKPLDFRQFSEAVQTIGDFWARLNRHPRFG